MKTSFSYQALLTEDDRAGLGAWLADAGELFVELEFPSSPCSGDWWLVRSMDQLLDLLASVTWPQVEVTVFRQPQLPLRGMVDGDFRRRALDLIPDGQWYAIHEIAGQGPCFCRPVADGETHVELLRDLEAVEGRDVAVGLHPFETRIATEPGWPFLHSEEVFYVSVRRNRGRWPPCDDTPPDQWPAWAMYASHPGFDRRFSS